MSTAWAQDVDEFGVVLDERAKDTARPTPQNIAVEVRFGPYEPSLPTTPQGNFGDLLGRGRRVMVGIEGDWQALRIPKLLSLGPGVGIAYTRLHNQVYGKAGYEATLKFTPQWMWAVMRLDVLQQRWDIPLVFVGKLGGARASWWATNTVGSPSKTSGSTQGLAWALGAMFDLGFLEPARARHLDQISGVNHMYLFWEWYRFKLDDFGNRPDLLGDSTWTMGWALDM
jgi:hypothetical protein